MLATMQALNLLPGGVVRSLKKLCAGQTLLCKALALTVKKLDQKQLDVQKFYLEDVGYQPQNIIQTRRMGIPPGRDEHLPYRMVDENNRFILKL
jgi:DNA-3-methyladenine glycosylase